MIQISKQIIHTLEDACEDDRDPREDEEDMERVEAERTCKFRFIFINKGILVLRAMQF